MPTTTVIVAVADPGTTSAAVAVVRVVMCVGSDVGGADCTWLSSVVLGVCTRVSVRAYLFVCILCGIVREETNNRNLMGRVSLFLLLSEYAVVAKFGRGPIPYKTIAV